MGKTLTIRRAFAPVLLAAAVLASTLVVTRPQACPVYIPPQPLRTLYKPSERVVVARVGVKEVLSRGDEVAPVPLALHVTENLKGPPAGVLHLYQTEYKEDEEETAEAESEAQAEASAEASAASGDEGEETGEVEETPGDPEAARIQAGTERATRKRSAMLRDLLSRIDLFISTGQLASN